MSQNDKPEGWREKLHEIIFEADTPAGKFFDVALLISIVLSIVVVILESMPVLQGYDESFANNYNGAMDFNSTFIAAEIAFTIIFTLEYVMRVIVIKKPWKYIFSFFGLVDLLSILPAYVGLLPFAAGGQNFAAFRALRLLRVFRVLKLARYLKEANVLIGALKQSRAKIVVFLLAVVTVVIIVGTIMYLVEGGPGTQFDSIPRSIYWAIVTLTTVGYGDISPQTDLGQFLSAIVMIMGYSIIAVPTGIVSAEIALGGGSSDRTNTVSCQSCSEEGHDDDAEFCKFCGSEL